jgi:hypothetical protein
MISIYYRSCSTHSILQEQPLTPRHIPVYSPPAVSVVFSHTCSRNGARDILDHKYQQNQNTPSTTTKEKHTATEETYASCSLLHFIPQISDTRKSTPETPPKQSFPLVRFSLKTTNRPRNTAPTLAERTAADNTKGGYIDSTLHIRPTHIQPSGTAVPK